MIKVINSITRHQGRTFTLVSEKISLDNGVTTELDIIRHPGASAIVPMIKKDEIILLKQYRHAAGGYLWEIPAGTFDGPEDPLLCARRELREETGFIADRWHKLGEIVPVPGYSDECIHIFQASDMTPAKQQLDVDEIIEVHTVKFEDALNMIYKGDIRDSKTIAGICLAQNQFKSNL
ncbi:NUDIX hydrolase [Desulfococcaceae bacterium HSG9]|nr:NUDIX hydrolase [Desulfococcaceae bacterium HSG9]